MQVYVHVADPSVEFNPMTSSPKVVSLVLSRCHVDVLASSLLPTCSAQVHNSPYTVQHLILASPFRCKAKSTFLLQQVSAPSNLQHATFWKI